MSSLTSQSKTLSYLLRHGFRERVKLPNPLYPHLHERLDHGFVPIDLCCVLFKELTKENIKQIVEDDKKNRYSIETFDGIEYVRANQGHSVSVPGLELVEITKDNMNYYPVVVHGTYSRFMQSINANGLNKMERNHIHFAQGMDAKSGARKDCDVFIHIDLEKALCDGLKFFVSRNGVILCEGPVSAKYFKLVQNVEKKMKKERATK